MTIIGAGDYETSKEAMKAADYVLGKGVPFIVKPSPANPKLWVWERKMPVEKLGER